MVGRLEKAVKGQENEEKIRHKNLYQNLKEEPKNKNIVIVYKIWHWMNQL